MSKNNSSFKPGQSGNPTGSTNRTRLKNRLEGLLEKALPVIEKEFETGSPEVKRELFIGLAGIVLLRGN
ncbi:hypothetical protein A0256_13600 [Mucilaginibacter sp. PAMC 26640]|nr:hypothetical protein A0256_13600 [Mucilaginibacter sp. PAMC 26640]